MLNDCVRVWRVDVIGISKAVAAHENPAHRNDGAKHVSYIGDGVADAGKSGCRHKSGDD